jgi:hypothetical protein
LPRLAPKSCVLHHPVAINKVECLAAVKHIGLFEFSACVVYRYLVFAVALSAFSETHKLTVELNPMPKGGNSFGLLM